MAKLDRLGCIFKEKATQMFQKRKQIFHRRRNAITSILAVFENSTDELLSDDQAESVAAEVELQTIIATSDLSFREKSKLRDALAWGLRYSEFQDIAAQYLAKYSKY